MDHGWTRAARATACRFTRLQPTVIASRAPHLLLEQSVMTLRFRESWTCIARQATARFVKPARLHFARTARALRYATYIRGVLSEFRAARTCASYWFDNCSIADTRARRQAAHHSLIKQNLIKQNFYFISSAITRIKKHVYNLPIK